MDAGTDAQEILENRLLPLRRGGLFVFVCVHFEPPGCIVLTLHLLQTPRRRLVISSSRLSLSVTYQYISNNINRNIYQYIL